MISSLTFISYCTPPHTALIVVQSQKFGMLFVCLSAEDALDVKIMFAI